MPFLQDVRLLSGVESKSVSFLMLERAAGGGPSFIEHGYASDKVRLTPAQAVRAMLAFYAFAPGGLGTPNPLIPRGKGGDLDKSSSSSLLCQCAVAILQGGSLDETILLNLVAREDVGTVGWQSARSNDRTPRRADGVADLYSRPTKTVLLRPDENGVVSKAVIVSGPPFEGADLERDPMVPHRLNSKGDRYLAFEFETEVALWRSAHVLLAKEGKPLKTIDQLRRLTDRGMVDLGQASIRVLGISGKEKKPSHSLWRDEELPFGHSVITGGEAYDLLENSVNDAKMAARQTWGLLMGFSKRYLGQGDKKPKEEDVKQFLNSLAPDLADFWSAVGPEGEKIALDGFDPAEWKTTLGNASRKAFDKAIERLPADARRFRAEYAREESADKAKGKRVL